MSKHRFEALFKSVLDYALPNTVWSFHGKTFETEDAVSMSGLLKIFLMQGMCMMQSLRGQTDMENDIRYIYSPDSLTGVCVELSENIACAPLLLFALDAALLAQALAPGEDGAGRPVIVLDVIEKPIRLSADSFFHPIWQRQPKVDEDAILNNVPDLGQGGIT